MPTFHGKPDRYLRLAALALAVAGAALAGGCGSAAATVAFTCAPEINGGTLLTVDVVRATEPEVERIRALGEKWFYDPLRDSLRDRTRTATFSQSEGRCEKELDRSRRARTDKFLVIVADYRFQSADPGRHLVVMRAGTVEGPDDLGSRSATGNSRSSSREEEPPVLWAEGMFLRPHHLQAAERYREEALHDEIRRIQPFFWGLTRLDVAPDQLENFVFELRDVEVEAEGRLRAVGRLDPPDLPAALQGRARPGGRADGGLPRRPGDPRGRRRTRSSRARTGRGQDRRLRAEILEVPDENTGANRQPVETRLAATGASSSGPRTGTATSASQLADRRALGPGQELPGPLEGLHPVASRRSAPRRRSRRSASRSRTGSRPSTASS